MTSYAQKLKHDEKSLGSLARVRGQISVIGSDVGPSDYYPKYQSKYFRFENKPKYVKIL